MKNRFLQTEKSDSDGDQKPVIRLRAGKRIAAGLLLAAAILTVLGGCASGNPAVNPDSESTAIKKEDRSKMEFYITYPDYNTKAFTVSYDDGTIQDKKVMSLARKYKIGVTFAPNTAWWGSSGYMEHEGYTVWVQRPTREEKRTA